MAFLAFTIAKPLQTKQISLGSFEDAVVFWSNKNNSTYNHYVFFYSMTENVIISQNLHTGFV